MAEIQHDFYRYTDAQGVEHLVEGLDQVPTAFQSQAQAVQQLIERSPALGKAKSSGLDIGQLIRDKVSGSDGVLNQLSSQSFGGVQAGSFLFGGASAVTLVLAWFIFRQHWSRRLRLAVITGLLASLGFGYVTLTRATSGIPRPEIGTPYVVVDQAKKAAEAARAHVEQQGEALKQLTAPEKTRR